MPTNKKVVMSLLTGIDVTGSQQLMTQQLKGLAKDLKIQNLKLGIDPASLMKVSQQIETAVGRAFVEGMAKREQGIQGGITPKQSEMNIPAQEAMLKLTEAIHEKYKNLGVTVGRVTTSVEDGFVQANAKITDNLGIVQEVVATYSQVDGAVNFVGPAKVVNDINAQLRDSKKELGELFGDLKTINEKMLRDPGNQQLSLEFDQKSLEINQKIADQIAMINNVRQLGMIDQAKAEQYQDSIYRLQEKQTKQIDISGLRIKEAEATNKARVALDQYKIAYDQLQQLELRKQQKFVSTEVYNEQKRQLEDYMKSQKEHIILSESQAAALKKFEDAQANKTAKRKTAEADKQWMSQLKELEGLYKKQVGNIQQYYAALGNTEKTNKAKFALSETIKQIQLLKERLTADAGAHGYYDSLIEKLKETSNQIKETVAQQNRMIEVEKQQRAAILDEKVGKLITKDPQGQDLGKFNEQSLQNTDAVQKHIAALQGEEVQIRKNMQSKSSYNEMTRTIIATTQQSASVLKDTHYEYDKAAEGFRKVGETTRLNANRLLGWNEQMAIAIKRMAVWGLTANLLYGNLRKIREGVQFMTELDKELTQVAIIQGINRASTKELAEGYAELGLELRKTVTEISQVNTELIRQGLTLGEAEKRMQTILKLSSTGMISVQDSLRIITTSVNAMQVNHERAADVLLRASQISASSVEQLGEAFTKTASSSYAAGVSIEQTTAILATMTEVTQEGPSQLGTSLKTILARFNAVNEETGEINEDLNRVQKAMESVGIEFVDQAGQIRNVYDILEDLSGVWDSLSKNQQAYIATTSAGVRMQNRFYAIMNNFSTVQRINNELMGSAGTLAEGYAIYLTGVEAASNRAQAAMEQLWTEAINRDAITFYYDMITAITKFITKLGPANAGLTAIGATLALNTKLLKAFRAEATLGAGWQAMMGVMAKSSSGFANLGKTVGTAAGVAGATAGAASQAGIPAGMTKMASGLVVNSADLGIAASNISQIGAESAKSATKLGALSQIFGKLKVAGTGVGAALASLLPMLGAIAIALAAAAAATALVKLLYNIAQAAREAREEAVKAANDFLLFERSLNSTTFTIEQNYKEMQELSTQFKRYGSMYAAPLEDQERFMELNKEMLDTLPDLNTVVDQYGNTVVDLSSGYGPIIDEFNKEKEELRKAAEDSLPQLLEVRQKQREKSFAEYNKAIGNAVGPQGGRIISKENQEKAKKEYEKELQNLDTSYLAALRASISGNQDFNRMNQDVQDLTFTILPNIDIDELQTAEAIQERVMEIAQSLEGSSYTQVKVKIDTIFEQYEAGEISRDQVDIAVGEEINDFIKEIEENKDIPEELTKNITDALRTQEVNLKSYSEALDLTSLSFTELRKGSLKTTEALDKVEEAQKELNETGSISAENMDALLEDHPKYIDLLWLEGEAKEARLEQLRQEIIAEREVRIEKLKTAVESQKAAVAQAKAVAEYAKQSGDPDADEHVKNYEKAIVELEDAIKSLKVETYAQDEATENYLDTMDASADKINTYIGFLEELKSAEGLSEESRRKILRSHEEFSGVLHDEIELRKRIEASISAEEEAYRQAYISKIENSQIFWNETIKGNDRLYAELSKLSNANLDEAKSLAQARLLIESSLVAQLSGIWGRYYNAVTGTFDGTVKDSLGKVAAGGSDEAKAQAKAQLSEILKAEQKIRDARNAFNDIATDTYLPNIDWFKGGAGGGGGASGANEFSEELDLLQIKLKNVAREITVLEATLADTFDPQKRQELIDDLINARKREQEILKQALEFYSNELANDLAKIPEALRNAIQTGDFRLINLDDQDVSDTIGRIQSLQGTIEGLEDSLHSASNAMNQLWQQGYDTLLTSNERALEGLSHQLSLLDDTTENYTQRNDLLAVSLDITQFSLDQTVAYLEKLNAAYLAGEMSLNDYERAQDYIIDKMRQLQLEVKRLSDERLRAAEKQADEEIEAIKKGYREQKDAAINAINERLKAEEKAHDERMRRLDEELNAYNDIIDAKLKMLERADDERSFEMKMGELLEEKAELQAKINLLSLDDSLEAQNEKKALLLEMDDLDKNIAETQYQRDLTLQKEHLGDLKDAKGNEIDEAKKAAEQTFEAFKNNLEAQRDAQTAYWDRILEDETAFNSKREELVNQYLEKTGGALDRFLEQWQGSQDAVIQRLMTDLNSYLSMLGGAGTSGITTGGAGIGSRPVGTNTETGATYRGPDYNSLKAPVSLGDGTYKAFAISLGGVVKELLLANGRIQDTWKLNIGDVIRTLGGYYQWNGTKGEPFTFAKGGETTATGLHWLDGLTRKPERILTSEQTEAFNKLVDYLPRALPILSGQTRVPNITNTTSPINIDTLVKIEGNVDKNVMEDLKRWSNELLDQAVKRMYQDQKKNLNMAGVFTKVQ